MDASQIECPEYLNVRNQTMRVGAVGGVTEWTRIATRASARRAVATFNSVGVTGRNAHQPRLRWARMAEMVAVVASALPPPKWA